MHTPSSQRSRPFLAAIAMGAVALAALNTVRLSALSGPAGLVIATALPQAAQAMPSLDHDASVPAASTVRFPADEAPVAPTF